jgi:hypothetical protein
MTAGPGGSGTSDEPAGDVGRHQIDFSGHDPFEPPEPTGRVRGLALVIIVVVLGALLMPSATRAPLAVTAAARLPASTPTTSTPTTAANPTSTTTAPPATATIHVLVANGTTVNGVAGSVTTYLGGKGFSTLAAVNALTKLTSSQVYYTAAGSSAEAAEVASALGLASSAVQAKGTTPPVSSSSGASVVVIVGQDLATRFAPASTTTTKG